LAPEVKPDASDPAAAPDRRELLPLPGLAVIALYMLVLSGVDILGVAGGHIRAIYLIFAAIFIAAGLGLLLLFRWAWTLTLAAVVLLFGLFLWRFSAGRDVPSLAQGLLNLVIFLYLIRPEVRTHLR
jgi:lysylphosphatidylglycerol synthetase-like protein (DUF2156 family)